MLGRRRFRWPENDLCWPKLTCFLAIHVQCLLPNIAYCRMPNYSIAYRLLPIACCLLPVAPIAYCLLPIAYCQLHIAYCVLPTAYCLLPMAYCQLPVEVQLGPKLIKCWARND